METQTLTTYSIKTLAWLYFGFAQSFSFLLLLSNKVAHNNLCVYAYLVGRWCALHNKNNQPLTSLYDFHIIQSGQCHFRCVPVPNFLVIVGVELLLLWLLPNSHLGDFNLPNSIVILECMSTSAYLCYGVNFVCWCPPCFYLFIFFLSFFSFVEYILHKYGISAISFACWTFCIFQSHIMISGTSWKKFQNSLVEWQKEAQTEWNKTWALSAIRRETIDTPVYFCTVCRWKCIRAHQSVMKFMNANRSTNEFMCQCMFTIQ